MLVSVLVVRISVRCALGSIRRDHRHRQYNYSFHGRYYSTTARTHRHTWKATLFELRGIRFANRHWAAAAMRSILSSSLGSLPPVSVTPFARVLTGSLCISYNMYYSCRLGETRTHSREPLVRVRSHKANPSVRQGRGLRRVGFWPQGIIVQLAGGPNHSLCVSVQCNMKRNSVI